MDGSDFIDLADDLLTHHSEARCRTSVSRAYYGAFHVARHVIESNGVVLPKGPESHNKLQMCLQHCGDKDVLQAALMLGSLRSDRNTVDYDLVDAKFTKTQNVQLRIASAKDIITRLAACDQEPLRSTVHAAVRQYATNVLRLQVT